MAELATAWISLRVSAKNMKGDVASALQGIENQSSKTGTSMGQKISSGMGSALKKGAVATGVAAGAALGTALTKGIGRLNAIEQAESKLTGLGHSASTVQGAMDDALKAVKGTAFGLDEAATTASMVMAAGIKPGKELEQVLTTVGDTAAIAGTSMSEMGDIFGKVAAKGKLQGDDLNRLTERGIPALQLLSEELGVTTEEAQKMASEGEISFEIFERAMRRGVGGAAQEMGNTTQGAFKNMMAAMGRFGATLAGPFFTQAGGVFRGLTDMFDNLDAKAGPVMERLGRWMTSTAVPALQKFGRQAKEAFEEFRNSSLVTTSLARLEGVFTTLGTVGVGVGSALKDIGSALLEAGKALGVSAWQIFLSTLEAGSAVLSALVGPLQAVSGFMKDHPGLVTAAVAAWTAFKTIPSILGSVTKPLSGLVDGLKNFVTTGGASGDAAKRLASAQETLKTAQTTAAASSGKVLAAEQRLMQLRLQAVTGTQRVKQAEAELTALRSSGVATKSQLAAAEQRLNTARQSSDATAKKIVAGEAAVASARNGAAGAASRAAAAETALARAQASASLTGRFRAVTQGIREYQAALMQANPAMSATSARITALGAAAGTAAQSGFSRLRAGASSLLSALGGPLGVALVGAGVGIMAVGSRSQNTTAYLAALEDRSKSVASAQHSLGEALRATQGEFDDTATQAAIDSIDKYRSSLEQVASTAPGAMDTVGMAMDYLWTGLWKGSDAARDVAQSFTEQKHATSEAQAAIEQLNASGMSNAQIFSRMASDTSWDALLAQMSRLGIEGGEQLNLWRDRIMSAADAAKTATPGTTELAEAFATLGNNAASADDKTNALKRALDALAGNQSAQEAVQQHNEVIRSTAEAAWDAANGIDNFGASLINSDGTINTTSANGSKLRDALLEIRDSTAAAIGAGADMGPVWEKNNATLDQVAGQLGLTREQVDGLAASVGYVPEYLELAVKAGGIESVSGQVVALSAMIRDSPDLSIETSIEDQAVRDKLLSLGYTIQDLPNGNVRVTAATDEAKANMDSVINQANALDGTKRDVKIGANTSDFDLKKSWVDQQMSVYDGSFFDATMGADNNPAMMQLNATNLLLGGFGASMFTATMGANPGPAQSAHGGITGLMNQYTMSNPTTSMHANSGPAMGELGNVNNGMNQYKGSNPNTNILANGGQALGEIRTVDAAANQATRDRVINITTRYHVETPAGMQTGTGTIPRADGGFLPLHKFADGGSRSDIPSGFLPTQAMIAKPQGARGIVQWAERETEGEAFIPLAKSKRGRSTAILDQVASRFGYKLEKYADGGVTSRRTPQQFLDFVWNRTNDGQSRALDGAPYDWAGINWGDCSAAMAAIARFAKEMPPFGGRFATGNMREALNGMGFRNGRGPAGSLRFGWWNGGPGGGHTFGTLPDGTNVEMRGGGRGGIIGKDAWPWNHPQATDHAWLPVNSIKVTVDGLNEPFGDFQSSFSDALMGKKRASGITATSSGGSGAGTSDSKPRNWSEIAGNTAYNMVSGLTQDALGVFGIPDELPPILQAYNMMQDAEDHGGVSTWDVSTAAAKVKELEAQVELRRRLIAEGEKAVEVLNGSAIGNADPYMVSAAENRLTDEHREMLRLQDDLSSAKGRLQSMLDTRAAAELEKSASGTAASAAVSELPELGGEVAPDVYNVEIGPPKIEYDPAKGAEQWRPLVEYLLKEKGLASDKATVDAVIKRINQESTGNPRAQNNWDSNAAAGTPSKGLIQTIDPTFQSYKDPGHDDIWNPEDNLRASFNYVTRDPKFAGRSMKDIYLQAGGYWRGGAIPFGSGVRDDVPLVAAEGEYIVNRFAAARNRGLLEDINSGRSAEPRGGDTYNVYAFDLESSLKELDKRAKQRAFANLGVR